VGPRTDSTGHIFTSCAREDQRHILVSWRLICANAVLSRRWTIASTLATAGRGRLFRPFVPAPPLSS
jgi:hypothetical protein